MYLLPKFLSKIIKQEGFVLTSENDSRKFLIGSPTKAKPLEVKLSQTASELTIKFQYNFKTPFSVHLKFFKYKNVVKIFH